MSAPKCGEGRGLPPVRVQVRYTGVTSDVIDTHPDEKGQLVGPVDTHLSSNSSLMYEPGLIPLFWSIWFSSLTRSFTTQRVDDR